MDGLIQYLLPGAGVIRLLVYRENKLTVRLPESG